MCIPSLTAQNEFTSVTAAIMKKLDLTEHADHLASDLSGGTKRKVSVFEAR